MPRGLILSRALTLLGTGLGLRIVYPSLTTLPLVYVGASHRAGCPGVALVSLDSSASIHRGRRGKHRDLLRYRLSLELILSETEGAPPVR